MANKKKVVEEEVVEEGRIPIKANRPCYYGDVYRPEGSKFTVANENEISIGMDRLDGKEHPSEKRKREKKAEKPDSRTKELKTPKTIKEAGEQLI